MKLIRLYVAVATAATITSACDSASSDQILVPNASVLASSSKKVAETRTVKAANRNSAVIDAAGGTLTVGGHALFVPANAVSVPTQFSMQVVEAKAIHVKLKAWRVSDGAAVTQFPVVPLEIRLNAGDVIVPDGYSMALAYLVDGSYDGRMEVQRGTYDAATKIFTGYLTHFSEYVIIIDRTEEPSDSTYTQP